MIQSFKTCQKHSLWSEFAKVSYFKSVDLNLVHSWTEIKRKISVSCPCAWSLLEPQFVCMRWITLILVHGLNLNHGFEINHLCEFGDIIQYFHHGIFENRNCTLPTFSWYHSNKGLHDIWMCHVSLRSW